MAKPVVGTMVHYYVDSDLHLRLPVNLRGYYPASHPRVAFILCVENFPVPDDMVHTGDYSCDLHVLDAKRSSGCFFVRDVSYSREPHAGCWSYPK